MTSDIRVVLASAPPDIAANAGRPRQCHELIAPGGRQRGCPAPATLLESGVFRQPPTATDPALAAPPLRLDHPDGRPSPGAQGAGGGLVLRELVLSGHPGIDADPD